MILRKLILAGAAALLAFVAPSCISDSDIPYPNIQANIMAFAVEGQTRTAVIDTLKRSVALSINDSVNPRSVKVTRFELAPNAKLVTDTAVITSGIDLTDTLFLTLKVYRDYVWTITAVRNVTREFAVEGQVGPAIIDPEAHTIEVNVGSTVDLTAVKVTAMKLAGATATYSPELVGEATDFTSPVKVIVTDYGVAEQWTVTITKTVLTAELTSVDPWTSVAWLHASVAEGTDCRFEWRRVGSEAWQAAPDGWVAKGVEGEMICRLVHLNPSTDYEARVVDVTTDAASPEISFTTGEARQLPNSDFSNWWLDGKIWCPWAKDGEPFWGTGNKGATTLGDSNTTPLADADSSTGYGGASLETRFVGIAMLGKLAAGNLFTGTYVRTDGTNGVLSFGRPFTDRPTALRATIKYKTATISHSSTSFQYLKGQPDTCVVWCALIDSDEPFEIRTKPSDRHLFDEHGPEVIAYGRFQQGSDIDEFTTVDIPLRYVATDRVPKYILVVASASKYGDYFTGGAGALLTIRSYSLLYDYPD
ncbi:MAG: PCMD domain-containing protein [Alloprevotella sp.]|nr:PCMD domain-containing protein [Alloprevotella sp.]